VKIVNSKIYLKTLIIEWKEKIWKNGWILKKKKKKKKKVKIFVLKSKAEIPDIIIEFFTYLNNWFKEYTINIFNIFKYDERKKYKNKKKINKDCNEYDIEKSMFSS